MKENYNRQRLVRILVLIILDAIIINLAAVLALVTRFDFSYAAAVRTGFMHQVWRYAVINTVVTLLVFYFLRLYHSVWEFASSAEMIRIAVASIISSVLYWAGSSLLGMRVPRSFPLLYLLFLAAMIAALRDHVFYEEYPITGDTICDALVGGVGALSYTILGDYVDDIIEVKESSIRAAVKHMVLNEKFIVEGGSATTVAAVTDYGERVGGKNVALVMSGGNIDGALLRELLAD